MKKIFHTFLSHPVTTTMFFFSVVVVGLISVFNLPVELTPHVEYPRLSVSVSWPGVSPEAVEAHLTSPIEAELATLDGVKEISSTSSQGNCQISIEFHPKVDIDFSRVRINEKLSSIKNTLPFGISQPRISQYVPKEFENLSGFLTYSVSANRSANEVRKYLVENVLLKIKNIDGVSEAEVRGGSDRLIEITIDYNLAKAYGIVNEEINSAVGEAEKIISAGKIENNGGAIYVKIDNTVTDPSMLAGQVVKNLPNGNAVRLKDIAQIRDDFAEPTSYYRTNGRETVTLVIDKEPGTNTLSTAKLIKDKIGELSEAFPKDYSVVKEIDRSEDIVADLQDLYKDGIYSFFIIFLIILLLFRKWKYAAIIMSSIIFSLLASFGLFYLFDLTLNMITISCFVIGFGFIVDNSIVVVDYLDKHYSGRCEFRLTVLVKDIFLPLFTSTITITAVFLPLTILTGELQLYFKQFALGISFTLISSLVASFTVVPLLFFKTFHPGISSKERNYREGWLYRFYGAVAGQILKRKKLSILFLSLVIGWPVWLIPNRIETPVIGEAYNSIFDSETYSDVKKFVNYGLGGVLNLFFNYTARGELWRYGEETYLYVRLELPNGNKIERINKLCLDLENEILNYRKNIKNLIANVINDETAIIRINFTAAQANSAFPYMLKNYLTSYATRLGGVDSYVYGFGPGFSNAFGGGSSSFSVETRGFNYETVRSIAEKFRDKIKTNARVDNVDIDKSMYYWAPETYEVVGTVKRERLAAYGISVSQLFSVISKNTAGNFNYNRFRIKNESVDYRVKFSNYNDLQLEDLKNLIINEKGSEKLKISNLVDFQEKKVLSSIRRVNQQYLRNITFDFKGPYKFGQKFLESAIASMNVPEGYTIKPREFMFNFSDQDEIDIWKLLSVSILVIFMVTAAFFESFKKPLLILTSVPFAIAGAVFVFWFIDGTIDRGAYAGMLLLVGFSVSNSIVLVNYISGKHVKNTAEIPALVKSRLRALTTTSLTTFVALIPFVFNGNDDTFWKNLSISIMGGILVSYLYIIFFLPLLYIVLSKVNSKKVLNDLD